MLAREMDRLVDAVLRPVNQSGLSNPGNPDNPPLSPFLSATDYSYQNGGSTPITASPVLHGGRGSNILFADGHVHEYRYELLPGFVD